MAGPPRPRSALAALAGSLLLGACVIDLDHLSSGGTGGAAAASTTGSISSSGSGSSSSGSSSSGSSSSGAGDAGCPLLDCSCIGGPTAVAAGSPLADSPRGVALTSDGLYWADENGGAIVLAPASGGAPQQLAGADAPHAIDVSGGTVVWGAQEGLFTCTASSCAGTKQQVLGSAAPGSLQFVSYDGQTVVWSDLGSGPDSGKVIACALASCSPIDLQDNMIAPGGVRLNGDTAFWTDEGDGNQNGTVSSSPKTTASLSQLASELDLPAGIDADDTYVYWTAWAAGGQVLRCPKTGSACTPVDIAPAAGGLGHPLDLRVGGGRVYWTTTDDGAIRSCPQPGCGTAMPQVLVTGRQAIQRIAVGASCLFWSEDGNGGAVMRTAL
jgi:hypothetical protein